MGNENIFDKIEEESAVPTEEVPHTEEANKSTKPELPVSDEINFDQLSDKGIGEETKYNRENLDGKEVKILSAKMFSPDIVNDEIKSGLTNPDKKYYRTKFIITYDCENSDGMKNREYLSGAIQFIQKDKSIGSPQLWYEKTKTQVGKLFEKVAEFKGVEIEELSPREFMNFLNSGPKVLLKDTEVEYINDIYHKNLIEKFIK